MALTKKEINILTNPLTHNFQLFAELCIEEKKEKELTEAFIKHLHKKVQDDVERDVLINLFEQCIDVLSSSRGAEKSAGDNDANASTNSGTKKRVKEPPKKVPKKPKKGANKAAKAEKDTKAAKTEKKPKKAVKKPKKKQS